MITFGGICESPMKTVTCCLLYYRPILDRVVQQQNNKVIWKPDYP